MLTAGVRLVQSAPGANGLPGSSYVMMGTSLLTVTIIFDF